MGSSITARWARGVTNPGLQAGLGGGGRQHLKTRPSALGDGATLGGWRQKELNPRTADGGHTPAVTGGGRGPYRGSDPLTGAPPRGLTTSQRPTCDAITWGQALTLDWGTRTRSSVAPSWGVLTTMGSHLGRHAHLPPPHAVLRKAGAQALRLQGPLTTGLRAGWAKRRCIGVLKVNTPHRGLQGHSSRPTPP